MKLDSRQLNQLHGALLHAFDRDSLRIMLRLQLDESLDAVTGDDDLTTVIFDLITWAERTNRVGDLVTGALAANPNNPELQQLAADYARWQAAAPSAAPPAAPRNTLPGAPGDAPAAVPVTLPPVAERRGPNWALVAGAVVILALLAFWLLRPYLLPAGPVEPAPIGPTPIESTLPVESPLATEELSATATETPTPVPRATDTAEPTAMSSSEPSATSTPEPSATYTPEPTSPATATASVTSTAQPPRAPALRVGPLMKTFNEESRLLTVKSGESLTLDMQRLWSAPQGTPVDCASGMVVASWQVRQPYPGGEDLEIRRPLPRSSGQTELLQRGARGNVTLGYCDEVILQNQSLEDYRIEWRYVSAIAKP